MPEQTCKRFIDKTLSYSQKKLYFYSKSFPEKPHRPIIQTLQVESPVQYFYAFRDYSACRSNQLLIPLFQNIFNKTLEMYEEQKKSANRPTPQDWRDDLRRGRWRREKMSGPSIFIAKTYEILENDSYSDIVVWNEEGTHFTILDVDRFEQEILPVYFRHRNFSSFVRQLNMYDFHKIRNQQNKNIFEHRQFRRDAKSLLRNIRRKGCTNKKSADHVSEISEEPQTPYEHYEDNDEKNETQRPTEAVIEKESQVDVQRPKENPMKNQLLQDFIASLPDIVQSEQQVRQIIKEMKKDSRYRCLNSKEDVRKVVHKIRSSKMRKEVDDGLEQLSIEEQIMVQNVDDREPRLPTLAVVSSDNYLPLRTQNLICSLILCDDVALPKQN